MTAGDGRACPVAGRREWLRVSPAADGLVAMRRRPGAATGCWRGGTAPTAGLPLTASASTTGPGQISRRRSTTEHISSRTARCEGAASSAYRSGSVGTLPARRRWREAGGERGR